jgi:hypothetical protein
MTPKGADLEATDLIEVSTIESGSYVTRSITGQELIDAIPLPPTGLTIGTTPIASGTIGRVLFQGTGNVLQQSSSLFWDSTNNRLGIGTSSPAEALDVVGRLKGTTSAAGSMFSLAGVNNTSLSVANDSSGRAFIEVKGNTAATSAAGAYFTADGYQESWFNVISREAATNNKIWRFGNLGQSNYFGIQKLNDAANSILSNALIIFSSTSNIGINTTTDAGFKLDVNGTARVTTLTTTNLNSPSGTETIFIRNSGGTTAGRIFPDGSTFRMSSASGLNSLGIYNSGNLGINTTTDAGFRLDVNGTGRFSSQLSVSNSQGIQFTNGFSGLSGNCIYSQGSATLLFINRNQVTANFFNGGADTTQCIQFGNGIGVTQPVNSACALFDLVSTTKGFLPPRLTTAQKNAIVSPVAGLVVYDTTLNLLQFYNGTIWI